MRTVWMLLMGVSLWLAACAANTNTVNVEMNEFGFSPDRLTVKAGTIVTLNLDNTGALEHDFVILEKGENAHTPFKEADAQVYWKAHLKAREEQVFQFTAPKEPGEYTVVCGVAGHLEQKMMATMTVTP